MDLKELTNLFSLLNRYKEQELKCHLKIGGNWKEKEPHLFMRLLDWLDDSCYKHPGAYLILNLVLIAINLTIILKH